MCAAVRCRVCSNSEKRRKNNLCRMSSLFECPGGVALNRDLSTSDMKNLSTYLNDHLAGSVAALELLDRLVETYDGEPLARFFHKLRREIGGDKAILQKLIQKLGVEESKTRKAAGWMVEKLSRPKIPLSKAEESEMGLLLALEALALGITESTRSGERWLQRPKMFRD